MRKFALGTLKKFAMSQEKWLERPVKGLLLDITGVLKDGHVAIEGSVEAVKSLQAANFPFRLVTNETSRPVNRVLETLNMLGYNLKKEHIFAPVPAVVKIIKEKGLRPYLLLHPEVFPEFSDIGDMSEPNCVVIGDAAEYFQYELLNECFRKLIEMENPIFFSLGQGKYFQEEDGLALDVGPFCRALEYATGVTAINVGKPSSEFFMSAVSDLKLQPSEVVMIGDDIESDVGGAQRCGLRGVQVRTGKYRKEKDEPHKSVVPDGYVNNLEEAVNLIITKNVQMISS